MTEHSNNIFLSDGRHQRMHLLPKTKDRAKIRSKTYPGIARAMSDQWTRKSEGREEKKRNN